MKLILVYISIVFVGFSLASSSFAEFKPYKSNRCAAANDRFERESFVNALRERRQDHELLRRTPKDFVEQVRGVFGRFSERADEMTYYFLKNVHENRSEIERLVDKGDIPNLERKVEMEFANGERAQVDPHLLPFFYGMPGRIFADKGGVLRNHATYLEMMAKLGVQNSTLTPVTKTFADTFGKKKDLVPEDGGYDVMNPHEVSPKFGTVENYQQYLRGVGKKGGLTVHDFIVTHKDPRDADFPLELFVHRKTMPEYSQITIKGTTYIEYRDKETGQEWRVEFDPANPRTNHYEPYVGPNGETFYIFHHFKPNQGSLDLTNPKAWDYVFQLFTTSIKRGVTAGRVDATPYLATINGTASKNLAQSYDMLAVIALFTQAVRPGFVLIPEVVGGKEVIGRYMEAVDKGAVAYEFELPMKGMTGIATGNFAEMARAMQRPGKWEGVIHNSSTHDHHAFVEVTPEMQRFVEQRGGIASYDGWNVAISGRDLTKRRAASSRQEAVENHQLQFAMSLGLGNATLFYPEVFGKRTTLDAAWREAAKLLDSKMFYVAAEQRAIAEQLQKSESLDANAREQLREKQAPLAKELVRLRDLKKDLEGHDQSRAPDIANPLWEVFDPRWVKRPEVTAAEVQAAIRGENPFFNSVAEMLAARDRSMALTMGNETAWLNTQRSDVASWVKGYRRPKDGRVMEEAIVLIKPEPTKEMLENGYRNDAMVNIESPAKFSGRSNKDLRLYDLVSERYLKEGQDYWLSDGHITVNMKEKFYWLRIDPR